MLTPPCTEDLVGAVFGATYRLERQIASGGMGAIFEAGHARLPNKRYAVKVLHSSIAGNEEARARFRREAEIACRLAHRNIVDVLDFNETPDGRPYLVMELLEGQSLADRHASSALSQASQQEILRDVAEALAAAHAQGVVHRDMKPDNIFLARQPDGRETVKVVDFGISKLRDSSTLVTRDHAVLGTVHYMSPEQAEGTVAAIDARTDIFALGTIAYQLLTGALPFEAPTLPGVIYRICHHEPDYSRLAPEVAAVLRRAMAKSQVDRYDDVRAFAADLSEASEAAVRRAADEGAEGAAAAAGATARTADAASATAGGSIGTDATASVDASNSATRSARATGSASTRASGATFGAIRPSAAVATVADSVASTVGDFVVSTVGDSGDSVASTFAPRPTTLGSATGQLEAAVRPARWPWGLGLGAVVAAVAAFALWTGVGGGDDRGNSSASEGVLGRDAGVQRSAARPRDLAPDGAAATKAVASPSSADATPGADAASGAEARSRRVTKRPAVRGVVMPPPRHAAKRRPTRRKPPKKPPTHERPSTPGAHPGRGIGDADVPPKVVPPKRLGNDLPEGLN